MISLKTSSAYLAGLVFVLGGVIIRYRWWLGLIQLGIVGGINQGVSSSIG